MGARRLCSAARSSWCAVHLDSFFGPSIRQSGMTFRPLDAASDGRLGILQRKADTGSRVGAEGAVVSSACRAGEMPHLVPATHVLCTLRLKGWNASVSYTHLTLPTTPYV